MPKPNNRCRLCHSPKRGSNLKFIRVGDLTGPREYECEGCATARHVAKELANISLQSMMEDTYTDDSYPGQDLEAI